jgi:WD40 repeat protein
VIESKGPREHTVHVWDLQREVEIAAVPLDVYSVHAWFSADGTRMMTDYWQAQLWSLPDGRRLAQLNRPAHSNVGALSPDGRRAVTTNLQDFSLEIWDVEGKPRRLLRDPGLSHNTGELIFTPDGKRLLVAGSYDALFLYDTEEGRLLRRFELGGGTFYKAALSPDGGLVAVGGEEGTVQVFEVDSGVLRARLRGEHGSVGALQFAPDGRRLVVGTAAGNADVWELPGGVPARWTIPGAPEAAAVVPAADRLILADAAGAPVVHRASDGRELARLRTDGPRVRVALTSDAALAMTRAADGRVELWDAATGELRCAVAWPTRQEQWSTFAFTADDAAVVLDDGEFAVHLWSTADCRAITTLREDWKTGLTLVDSRPELFVSGTRDNRVLLDMRRLAPPVPLAPWPNMIEEATRTHDGTRVLLYGHANDGKTAMAPLRLVDAATGATLVDQPENVMRPFQLEFAPDDATFLAVTLGRAQLYGADDLVPLHPFDGLPAAPAMGAFSPDGERVAVVDEKGAVGLWETRSGTFGGVLTHLRGRPRTLAFSDDGADLIVVGGAVGAARVPATTDGLLAASDHR